MNWGKVLNKWETGYVMSYNIFIGNRFFFETSVYENDSSLYEEKIIECPILNNLHQNIIPFENYIYAHYDKAVTSFYNSSRTAKLVIPIPQSDKNFTTLKDFIDNASENHQKQFWKCVAYEIRQMNKLHKKIWVSTHGLEVGYLHVRIDTYPKYYVTKEFVI